MSTEQIALELPDKERILEALQNLSTEQIASEPAENRLTYAQQVAFRFLSVEVELAEKNLQNAIKNREALIAEMLTGFGIPLEDAGKWQLHDGCLVRVES